MKVILLSLLMCISLLAAGQSKDISGTYFSKFGEKIEITNNELVYIIPQEHLPTWDNDTLARCTFVWVDDNFIEISSVSPVALGREGLSVSQYQDPTLSDSIKVYFSLPNYTRGLNITVYTNTFKRFYLNYSATHKELALPSDVKSITFYIKPDLIRAHTPDGLFYGAVGFDPFQEYKVEDGNNSISIEIPAINYSFFEMYHIKGDYAKVSKDTITWKGELFVRRN